MKVILKPVVFGTLWTVPIGTEKKLGKGTEDEGKNEDNRDHSTIKIR